MRLRLSPLPLLLALSSSALAQVPAYRVEVVDTYTTSTVLRGASDTGFLVGYTLVGGLGQPFVATQGTGLNLLPLPTGYASGFANDVNAAGVVVGAVSGASPLNAARPAIWTPNGAGGYDVTLPQVFTTLPSPLGPLAITGGEATCVNDNGIVVGYSQYQGFQGGPTTQFFLSGPPVDLRSLGFQATVTDISDTTDLIVGGDLRMDLNTLAVTTLGAPPPQQPGNITFSSFLAYGVNDAGQVIGAARLATSSAPYLTYRYDDVTGWTAHNPPVVPYPFVGLVYTNNDLGDISAWGGVYFAAEDALFGNFDQLLTPASAHWNPGIGIIGDDRRIYTTAVNTQTSVNALVVLVPEIAASTTVRNGSGVNPLAFSELGEPVIGTTWQAQVDLATHGGQVSFVAASVAPAITVPLAFGELLVQTPYLEFSSATGLHSFPIPNDAGLAGRNVRTQAGSWEPGVIRLFNGLDLVLGF